MVLLLGTQLSFAQRVDTKDVAGATITTEYNKNNKERSISVRGNGDDPSSVVYKKGNLFKRSKVTTTDSDGKVTTIKARGLKRLKKKADLE